MRVLVIKLGALGDVVLALGPFEAIRRHHAADHITLLTSAPFAELARMSGYFDAVLIDERPKLHQVGRWLALRRRLRQGRFERVYDLQTSDRSGFYWHLLGRPRPEWSGIVRGSSHPHDNPARDRMHTLERQAEQLARAGIAAVPAPDLRWLRADTAHFAIAAPFVLLVPGGAVHRPRKRWPAARYRALAERLAAAGTTPVLLGMPAEAEVLRTIAAGTPRAVDLCGKTSLAEIAALARAADTAVGNDTGPMHLIAAVGCPSLVLFSADSDPDLSRPRGRCVKLLREARLEDLALEAVLAELPRRREGGPA